MKLGGGFHAGRPSPRASDAHPDPGSDSSPDERYHLVSVAAANAPHGCTGHDWLVYRIAQGTNGITGYRRGRLDRVSADLESIVANLNARREWRNKPESKSERHAAAVGRRKTAP